MASLEATVMVRQLSTGSEDVGFKIFYPTESKANYPEYSCRFETFGLIDDISGSAVGIDAIDALVNAMMRMDIFLKSSEEFKSGKIRWVGGYSADDLGLPWQSAKSGLAES